jgi:hypothetical protein
VNSTDTLLKQGGDGLKGGGRSGSVGIEVQSTMGKWWESGRMQVVLAIGQREKKDGLQWFKCCLAGRMRIVDGCAGCLLGVQTNGQQW